MANLSLLRDPQWVSMRKKHMERLNALFEGHRLDSPFFLFGIAGSSLPSTKGVPPRSNPIAGTVGNSRTNPYGNPRQWIRDALESLVPHVVALEEEKVYRPLCLEFGPYGVYFTSEMFGCEVFTGQDEQWFSRQLPIPIGTLQKPDLKSSRAWSIAQEVVDEFLAQEVSLPLFGLPTIGSALNEGINLLGDQLLMGFHLDPEAVRHDLMIINELLCDLHRWYLERVPLEQLQPVVSIGRCQPVGYGQLCGCSTQLLSAEVYREFVAPLDDALLQVYPNGGMIHLCGAHTQHIPVWRELKSFRAFQIQDRAAEDFELYFRQLREDQIIYVSPTANLSIERILAISEGRRVVIVADGYPKVR